MMSDRAEGPPRKDAKAKARQAKVEIKQAKVEAKARARAEAEARKKAKAEAKDRARVESEKKGAKGNSVILAFVYGIPLAIKLGFTYLGFKRRAKKAGKIFKRQLIEDGVDPKTADILTEDYLATSHIISRAVKEIGKRKGPMWGG